MKKVLILLIFLINNSGITYGQNDNSQTSALVMSMTQRSLVMPGYLTELKALLAKQAYDFWKDGNTEPYVSHVNVYSALHQANKYLDFDSTNMTVYNQVGVHSNKVSDIKFGNDPRYYYTSSADGTIIKWNIENPSAIPEVVYQSDHIIKSLDISDDGQLLLASCYQTGLVLIPLNVPENQDITTFEDPEPVQTAIFIPGEQRYLSVTKSGDLKIKGFDSPTEVVGHTSQRINQLAVDKNDGTIYAGTESGSLEAWEKPYQVKEDEITGIIDELDDKTYFGFKLGSYAINCMDISPDGRLLAIGREKGDVILWNLEEKVIERVISSHISAITDIDFSPTERILLTTSRDRTARLWDLDDSRKLPVILDDHKDWVFSGSFDLTGKTIVTGCGDQFIRTWPTDPAELADRICGFLTRNMSEEEWKEFIGKEVPYQKTCLDIE